MRLAGKVALIASKNSKVACACATLPEDAGVEVVLAQDHFDGGFEIINADFRYPEMPKEVIEEVVARKGNLDSLINNTAETSSNLIAETIIDEWERMTRVNLTARFLLSRYAIANFSAHGGGLVINVAMTENSISAAHHLVECPSQIGSFSLTRKIARQHRKDKFRCYAITQGPLTVPGSNGPADRKDHRTLELFGRLETIIARRDVSAPENVALLAAWPASDASLIASGQMCTVDIDKMAIWSVP